MIYSIIIPAHNEEQDIEHLVETFLSSLPEALQKILLEIIIVENGSTDQTRAAAERLAFRHPSLIRVLSLQRGSYGEAIREGMLASRGSHLSILECDFLDSGFVAASIERFGAGDSPLLVASKCHPRSVDRRPLKRRILTRLFNLVLRLTIGYPGTDTHGLKSMETRLAHRLCHEAMTTDEVLQTEIVLLAWVWGVPIQELPIAIQEQRVSPVSVHKRIPMVMHTISQLQRSLRRYQKRGSTVPDKEVT